MPELSIESNGRLEKTAVYFNGEQIRGVKEILLNLDENGTFDAVIQYEGSDKSIYTKNIFLDELNNLMFSPPAFSEEESKHLNLLQLQSNGDIADTTVAFNGQILDGLISMFLHVRSPNAPKEGILKIFSDKDGEYVSAVFKTEFVFRNVDETITRESIF